MRTMKMKHNNFTLKNKNEYGMVTEIKFDNMKTKVNFGFDPERVEYWGTIDKKIFDKIK